MYVNLGNIELYRNNSNGINDWMILSEVVDSGMSYEKPVYVRTIEELDSWFGKEFSSYSYFRELLSSRVTLYLYKPISTKDYKSEDYIDYSNFFDYTNITLYSEDVEMLELLKNDSSNCIIRVVDGGSNFYALNENKKFYGIRENEIGDRVVINEDNPIPRHRLPDFEKVLSELGGISKYRLEGDSEIYIWTDIENDGLFSFMGVNNLPQNVEKLSSSLNNRDTLLIFNNRSIIKEVHPQLDKSLDFTRFDDVPDIKLNESYLKYVDSSKLEEGIQTFAIDIYHLYSPFTEINTESGYIVVPSVKNVREVNGELVYDNYLYVFNGDTSWQNSVKEDYYVSKIDINNFDQFVDSLSEIGYFIRREKDENGQSKLIAVSDVVIPVRKYYNLDNISIYVRPSKEISDKILSNYFIGNKESGIRFYSKTIGVGSEVDESSKIKVKVEYSSSEDNRCRIIITRYGYSEVFEGPLSSDKLGEERLDYKISKESKLVYCEFGASLDTKLDYSGEYKLTGAKKELYSPDMYLKSLDSIFNESSTSANIDFFLVPNKYKYFDINKTSKFIGYYEIYETFLKYAKYNKCQFLIENIGQPADKIETVDRIPSTEDGKSGVVYYVPSLDMYSTILNGVMKILINRPVISIIKNGGDYIFNYNKDDENWLVYFHRSMLISGRIKRPGYYLFLKSILYNKFGESENRILYTSSINDNDPYEYQKVEGQFEKYKSNFLTNNNHMYYYKKYFNGSDYTTTIWMRFVISKIFRELDKNKWRLLSTNYVGKTRDILSSIMSNIKNSFSIVDDINITEFSPTQNTNSLKIGIETKVNDLIDNDIELDITINYNTY